MSEGWQSTFALKALLSENANESQKLGDLFQVQHCGVVELDDGHGLFVIRTSTAILFKTGGRGETHKRYPLNVFAKDATAKHYHSTVFILVYLSANTNTKKTWCETASAIYLLSYCFLYPFGLLSTKKS